MRLSKFIPLGAVGILALALWVGLGATIAQSSHGLTNKATVVWRQIIGIIQAGNLVGLGTGQVTGGSQPWSATRGTARVDLRSGDVRFEVRGLVLAGGNNIGTRTTIDHVKGTLVCDPDGSASDPDETGPFVGNSVLVDTELVPLSLQGDARFQGNVGPLPEVCVNEPDIAFLIRIPAGRWIANGAVRIP